MRPSPSLKTQDPATPEFRDQFPGVCLGQRGTHLRWGKGPNPSGKSDSHATPRGTISIHVLAKDHAWPLLTTTDIWNDLTPVVLDELFGKPIGADLQSVARVVTQLNGEVRE